MCETEARCLGQVSVGVVTGDGVTQLLGSALLTFRLHGRGDGVEGTLDVVGSLFDVRLKSFEEKTGIREMFVTSRCEPAHLLRVGLDGGGGLEQGTKAVSVSKLRKSQGQELLTLSPRDCLAASDIVKVI